MTLLDECVVGSATSAAKGHYTAGSLAFYAVREVAEQYLRGGGEPPSAS